MKQVSRALGRIVARATGELFDYLRSNGDVILDVRGPVSRQPPEIADEATTGYSTLSGSFALPFSWFEDRGWTPEIGLDQIRLPWDGAVRLATITQQLSASNSMLVFGIVLAS